MLQMSYVKLCANCNVKATYILYYLILLLHRHFIKLHYQVQDYVEENVLLCKSQAAFRVNFSTDSYLAQLTDFALTGMDKNMYTGMILMDLQKATDTLCHKILLETMTCLGFKTPVIKWFECYLPNRKFFVSVVDVFSEA